MSKRSENKISTKAAVVDIEQVLTKASELPQCPDWCEGKGLHEQDYDAVSTRDGALERHHSLDYGHVDASTDHRVHGHADLPHAFVAINQVDSLKGKRLTPGPLRVFVASDDYPSFTPSEARQLADLLIKAADRIDKIEGAK